MHIALNMFVFALQIVSCVLIIVKSLNVILLIDQITLFVAYLFLPLDVFPVWLQQVQNGCPGR